MSDIQWSRPSGRQESEPRVIKFTRHFTKYAEGSVLVEIGDTKVICTASVEEKVPQWMKDENRGWVTAEYGMLPRATGTRTEREAVKGKQSGRTQEIQRLIGRSLRAVVDLELLGKRTIKIDCDVIQADGGTRCASITGAYVALCDAIDSLMKRNVLQNNPLLTSVAAISVGIYKGVPVCDLDYIEDSNCDTDMNVVMTGLGGFVEIQGTAEGDPFDREKLDRLLALAKVSIDKLFEAQKKTLNEE